MPPIVPAQLASLRALLFVEGRRSWWRIAISTIVPLLFAATILVATTLYRDSLLGLARQGYAGVFIACFVANAGVLVPAPSTAVVMVFAKIYSPFWVAVVGGGGGACGGLISYIAGLTGRAIVDDRPRIQQLKRLVERYGVLTICTFAFLPLPFFDLVSIASGALRVPITRFLCAAVLGKVLKMMMYAYIGANLLPQIEPWLKSLIS